MMWIGLQLALSVVIALVTLKFLHDTDPKRRLARNIVIGFGVLSALVSVVLGVRSNFIAKTVELLKQTVTVDESRILSLTSRLKSSEESEHLLRDAVKQDARRIADLRSQLAIATNERVKDDAALRLSIDDDTHRISTLRVDTAALRFRVRFAATEAQDASAVVKRTIASVDKTDAEAISRSKEALAMSRVADAKAKVFHFPRPLLVFFTARLARERPGSSSIACVPGLETACDDLRDAFIAAGWPKPIVIKAASFYTGGGFDAPSDPNADAGLIINYRPAREGLARSLQAILAPAGFTTDVHRVPDSPIDQDLEFAIRFVDQK